MKAPRGKQFANLYLLMACTLNFAVSITEYENKIADLETETDRLSQALDSHKAATEESQAVASRKVQELARDVQKRVHFTALYLHLVLNFVSCRPPRSIN